MEKMKLYEQVRAVPAEAKKTIGAGRLKGFTDINPMWRIKKLTEVFGQSGVGWYVNIKDIRMDNGCDGEITVTVIIELFYRTNDGWSTPVVGVGSSMFVAKEKAGLRTNDEAYKMAYTDALSVACKALGVGADVYYAADRSKYSMNDTPQTSEPTENADEITAVINGCKTKEQLAQVYNTRYGGNNGASALVKSIVSQKLKEFNEN